MRENSCSSQLVQRDDITIFSSFMPACTHNIRLISFKSIAYCPSETFYKEQNRLLLALLLLTLDHQQRNNKIQLLVQLQHEFHHLKSLLHSILNHFLCNLFTVPFHPACASPIISCDGA